MNEHDAMTLLSEVNPVRVDDLPDAPPFQLLDSILSERKTAQHRRAGLGRWASPPWRWRLRPAYGFLAVLLVLGAIAAPALAFSSGVRSLLGLASAPTYICPGHFVALPPGWIQGNAGTSVTGSNSTTDTWAHSAGFSNLTDIPKNGIYIWLLQATHRSSPAPSALQQLRFPLNIQHPDQISNDKGPLPEYRFAGLYHNLYVDLRVDFGQTKPTPAMLQQAQTVLAGLRFRSGIVTATSACS